MRRVGIQDHRRGLGGAASNSNTCHTAKRGRAADLGLTSDSFFPSQVEFYSVKAFDSAGNLENNDEWTTLCDQTALQIQFRDRKVVCPGPPVVLVPGLASSKLRIEKSELRPDWEQTLLHIDLSKVINESRRAGSGEDFYLDMDKKTSVPIEGECNLASGSPNRTPPDPQLDPLRRHDATLRAPAGWERRLPGGGGEACARSPRLRVCR